jgi:hypothetical protein
MGRACTRMKDISEGNRSFRRSKRTMRDNIKTDLKGIVWECVDWTHLAQDRHQWLALVNTVTNLRVIQKAGNFF